jgi:hypothetical protein
MVCDRILNERGLDMMAAPDFCDSPYFDSDKWELKPGAPEELQKRFKKYMEAWDKDDEGNTENTPVLDPTPNPA